ncbi:sterol carrier family protein [Nesterenkonia sp.]|uniref:sterol carrier family protein n=1 Tax=Nesterenkonia sp. TaxID=704201 RepID=UPI00260B8DA9|nr:sterol carrier family protein [Nesterenkonia sp.]
MPARRRISAQQGAAAVTAWVQGDASRGTTATAVRYLLEELTERAPGNSVEVRVPPFGVTQCVAGPTHTRGTPPNVVECDAATWLQLATGSLTWEQASAAGRISASGTRADLSTLLPLI